MKQAEIFKKIGGIIEELSEQYDYLKTVQDDLNELELELFVSNAHFLTDHIEVLCKLNLQNANKRRPAPEKVEKPEKPEKQEPPREEKYFDPVVQQMKHADEPEEEKPKKNAAKVVESDPAKPDAAEENQSQGIDIADAAPKDSYSFIREEPETIRHELVLDESMIWDDEEPLPVEPEEETPKKKKNQPQAEVTTPEEVVEAKAEEPVEAVKEQKIDAKPAKETKP